MHTSSDGNPCASQGSPFHLGTPLASSFAQGFHSDAGATESQSMRLQHFQNLRSVRPLPPHTRLPRPFSPVFGLSASRVLSQYSQQVNFYLEPKGQEMNPGPEECSEWSALGRCPSILWLSGPQSIVFNSSYIPQFIFKLNLFFPTSFFFKYITVYNVVLVSSVYHAYMYFLPLESPSHPPPIPPLQVITKHG